MVNDSIRKGLTNDTSSLRGLSLLAYSQLSRYDSSSYYKLCAISRAAGILAARKKSIRRGYASKTPYSVKPQLISCYGFKIENRSSYSSIEKEAFQNTLDQPYPGGYLPNGRHSRSFTLTPHSLSLSIAREPPEIECIHTVGVDRNLRNLTAGNDEWVSCYDLSETVRIVKTTGRIVASFKRDDARLRRLVSSKYGERRRDRTSQILHNTTKTIVAKAVERREAIVLEDIRGIRSLYRRGNWQGRKHRDKMNAWSFSQAQKQIEYKARWTGLPVIRLSKRETRGSSLTCPRCGERLQGDKRLERKLWCEKCRMVMDRDRVAAINLARRGWVRFAPSRPPINVAQGGAVEAVKGNPTPTVIPGVDAPKLTYPPIS